MSEPASQFAVCTVRLPDVAPFPLVVNAARDQIIASHLLECGHWEWSESNLLSRLIRPGQRVIDVGANLGYYTVLAAICVGATGEVWAFEPEPENFRLLAANVALNGCRNVALMQMAAGEIRGTAMLHLSPNNRGDHRLGWNAQSGPIRESVVIEVISIDECLPQQTVDIVKIDTQGTELEVLRGMQQLIVRNRDRLMLMIEFAPGLLRVAGASVADYAATFMVHGAQVFTIRREGAAIELTVLGDLQQEFERIAIELAFSGDEDAGLDLLVFFTDSARDLHFAAFAELKRPTRPTPPTGI